MIFPKLTADEEWATKTRFEYCSLRSPDDGTKFVHVFNDQAQKLVGMDIPRRSLAIAKELAILTTNLPTAWDTSIFLRVDDERVDLIKALIVGPKDTPYENGCFIFDIFLPHSYNQTSPMVKSMTTNGGLYRYNPNLYADGKVCLSLLGTWSGPGWIAGKSTLLQVLISIQSLILCEEPYCNEPGWAGQEGSAASKKYSANIRRMTIIDAMANNIKMPPKPCEWLPWGSVINISRGGDQGALPPEGRRDSRPA
jgi:ubiquitin-protein ligase